MEVVGPPRKTDGLVYFTARCTRVSIVRTHSFTMAQRMVGRGDDGVPMVGCKRVSDGSKAHVDGTSGTPFLFAIHRVEAENALGAPRQASVRSVDVEVVEVGETGTNLSQGVLAHCLQACVTCGSRLGA